MKFSEMDEPAGGSIAEILWTYRLTSSRCTANWMRIARDLEEGSDVPAVTAPVAQS
jgi:hypothetical protein